MVVHRIWKNIWVKNQKYGIRAIRFDTSYKINSALPLVFSQYDTNTKELIGINYPIDECRDPLLILKNGISIEFLERRNI